MTSQSQIDYLLNQADPETIKRYFQSCVRKINQLDKCHRLSYKDFENSDSFFAADLKKASFDKNKKLFHVMMISCVMKFLCVLMS